MNDKDWKTFWEDTTDITWGSNGIVNQQTFQNMLPEQRTAYLNKLSQENYTNFTPEAIQTRYQDQRAIYKNNIQNLQQNKKMKQIDYIILEIMLVQMQLITLIKVI